MAYKKRMFLDKESFKAIGWQSELVVPKGEGIFGDRKPLPGTSSLSLMVGITLVWMKKRLMLF